eukprot:g2569.t1
MGFNVLVGVFALLRAIFWVTTLLATNPLGDNYTLLFLLEYTPFAVQFATYSLLMLFFYKVINRAEWSTQKFTARTTYVLVNLAVLLYVVVISIIAGTEVYKPLKEKKHHGSTSRSNRTSNDNRTTSSLPIFAASITTPQDQSSFPYLTDSTSHRTVPLPVHYHSDTMGNSTQMETSMIQTGISIMFGVLTVVLAVIMTRLYYLKQKELRRMAIFNPMRIAVVNFIVLLDFASRCIVDFINVVTPLANFAYSINGQDENGKPLDVPGTVFVLYTMWEFLPTVLLLWVTSVPNERGYGYEYDSFDSIDGGPAEMYGAIAEATQRRERMSSSGAGIGSMFDEQNYPYNSGYQQQGYNNHNNREHLNTRDYREYGKKNTYDDPQLREAYLRGGNGGNQIHERRHQEQQHLRYPNGRDNGGTGVSNSHYYENSRNAGGHHPNNMNDHENDPHNTSLGMDAAAAVHSMTTPHVLPDLKGDRSVIPPLVPGVSGNKNGTHAGDQNQVHHYNRNANGEPNNPNPNPNGNPNPNLSKTTAGQPPIQPYYHSHSNNLHHLHPYHDPRVTNANSNNANPNNTNPNNRNGNTNVATTNLGMSTIPTGPHPIVYPDGIHAHYRYEESDSDSQHSSLQHSSAPNSATQRFRKTVGSSTSGGGGGHHGGINTHRSSSGGLVGGMSGDGLLGHNTVMMNPPSLTNSNASSLGFEYTPPAVTFSYLNPDPSSAVDIGDIYTDPHDRHILDIGQQRHHQQSSNTSEK